MPILPGFGSRLLAPLLSRRAGVVAAVAVLVILLGCMSISIGKFGTTGSTIEADGVLCQEGEATVPPGVIWQVHYPIPFLHPPSLEVGDTFHRSVLIGQDEGCFRVRNDSSSTVTVSWKARGLKATVAPVVVPPPEPPPVVPVSAGGAPPPPEPVDMPR
jgi:hypothetical protein